MTCDINSFTDANGQPIQPYYAAFMIEKGHEVPLSGDQSEFIAWTNDRWREFCALLGVNTDQRPYYRGAFGQWLRRRALDHAARNDIEGGCWIRPAPSRHRSPQLKFGFSS